MATINDLFIEMLDAGSITISVSKTKALSIRTRLYRELKKYKSNDLSLFQDDPTMIDRLTNSSIRLHYNEEENWATYEFASKQVQEFQLVATGVKYES